MLIEYEFKDVFENVNDVNAKSFLLVFKLRVSCELLYKNNGGINFNKSTVIDV